MFVVGNVFLFAGNSSSVSRLQRWLSIGSLVLVVVPVGARGVPGDIAVDTQVDRLKNASNLKSLYSHE